MRFDLAELAPLVQRHGSVARIVVTDTKGSTPRETGACMWIWADGQTGTIGGGTLEHQAVAHARAILGEPVVRWRREATNLPLGPRLGQCCGGAVTLLTEVFRDSEVATLSGIALRFPAFKRPCANGIAPPEFPVHSTRGWFSEPFAPQGQPLWIYGAGHVGRALVALLPGLGFDITWVDTAASRFPEPCPHGVCPLIAANPADAVRHAPDAARHLVLTYSHALDLEICHQILTRPFEGAGLIGSATKWARFRKRLLALGHGPARVDLIACPIGLPELGKVPEAIAVGVATELLRSGAGHLAPAQLSEERAS